MHVLPVQGNVYMLVADGVNLTASVGGEGVLLVNTGAAAMSEKVLAALGQLANATVTPPMANACAGVNCPGTWGWSSPYINAVISSPGSPKPLRFIMNTSADADHVGGNEKIVGSRLLPARRRRSAPPSTARRAEGVDRRARERAEPHERAGRQAGGHARSGVADRHLLRRVLQAAGLLQRRGGDRATTRRPPTPTATASSSSAAPR